mmetsp:Transcript_39447/g.92778  ORF Transcript_39447/g.92778 Transcript_39447/m.92778 type:complete len:147 (+) Transcript_39447:96-536(+)
MALGLVEARAQVNVRIGGEPQYERLMAMFERDMGLQRQVKTAKTAAAAAAGCSSPSPSCFAGVQASVNDRLVAAAERAAAGPPLVKAFLRTRAQQWRAAWTARFRRNSSEVNEDTVPQQSRQVELDANVRMRWSSKRSCVQSTTTG